MKRERRRLAGPTAALIRLALAVAALILAIPALAQTPRQHRLLDDNGVDLTHGDNLTAFVEGSIGSGDGELQLIRTAIGHGIFGAHQSAGGHQWDSISFQHAPAWGGGIVITISKDGRFEQFTGPGTLPSGSTLSGAGGEWLYRTADGAVIAFSNLGQSSGPSTFCNDTTTTQSYCTLVPTTIAAPDGRTVTIAWELLESCEWPPIPIPDDPLTCSYYPRIASVANSYGYSIAFTYASQGGGVPPPASWQRRTGATFHNAAVGSGAQASVSYSYPSSNVVDVTDMAGQVWRFTGDSVRITGIRRPGAAADTTAVTYTSNQVSSVTKDGVTTAYARSVAGTTATMTVTNALSQATTVVSNLTIGRPTSVTDALSRTTSFQYDASARPTRTTLPEGNYVQLTYDARGNVTQRRVVAKPGSGQADIVTSASYDAACSNPLTCNQPNSTTDAKGKVTDYTYDSTHGGVLTVTGPADGSGVRPQTRYGYTQINGEYRLTSVSSCSSGTAPSCVGTANESRTLIGYGANANANVVSVERRDGTGVLSATQTAAYDARGNLTAIDGPLPGTADKSVAFYNAARQPTGVISADPDGAGTALFPAVKYNYRPDGQLDVVETGTVTAQFANGMASTFNLLTKQVTTYDTYHRPVRQVVSNNVTAYQITDQRYDAAGRIQCTMLRMNPANWATLPSNCNPTQTTGPNGPDRVIYNTYDALGRVTKVTTGYGVTGLAADEVTTTFTANGKVSTVTDAEGNKTAYTYDGYDRPFYTVYPHPTMDGLISNCVSPNPCDVEIVGYYNGTAWVPGYDANGNVTSFRTRRAEILTMAYDNLNRLTRKTVPQRTGFDAKHTRDVHFGYDLLGGMTSACFGVIGNENTKSTDCVSNTFNALGQVTASTTTMDGTARQLSYAYDLAGNLTRLTHPDGMYADYLRRASGAFYYASLIGPSYLFYPTLDVHGRPDKLHRVETSSWTWAQYTQFGYDAVSRLSNTTINLAGASHDATTSFTYNPASQIASTTRTNDAYAWSDAINVNRGYTANGLNQYTAVAGTSVTYDTNGNLTSDGTNTYVYDVENRLVSRSGGGSTAALRYDPLGRLYEVVGSATGTTRFLHDGSDLVAEYNGSNAMLRRYFHGLGAGDDPLVWFEGSGLANTARRYLYADERGSITAITDSVGAVLGVNTYDEHGIPGSANQGRFQYTGQVWLPELGMYYYKARMYSPTLGRFMQTDPIGYGDGMNMYAYVGNDPVNAVDPSGLCSGPPYYTNCEIVVTGKRGSGGGGGGGGGGFTIPQSRFSYPEPLTGNEGSAGVAQEGPQKEEDACTLALQQGGQIEYGGATGTLVALAGFQGSWGSWKNLKTGTHGDYITIGGGVGAGIGLTRDYGKVRSLADFAGYGETASVGVSVGPVGGGYSATQNAAGDWVSSGGSLGYSPSVLSSRRLGASATGTAGETFIRNCHVHGN